MDRRAGRQVAKIVFDACQCVVERDVAGNHQRGVGRAVVGLEPVAHVVQGGGAQVGAAEHAAGGFSPDMPVVLERFRRLYP